MRLIRIIVKGCVEGSEEKCKAYIEGSDTAEVIAQTADEAVGLLAASKLLATDAIPVVRMKDGRWYAAVSGDLTVRGIGPSKYEAIGDFLRNHGEKHFRCVVVTR